MNEDYYEQRPKLYSKATIVIFSILLSTFFGGVIYSQNLSETGNRKQIAPVLIFCIIWNIICLNLAHGFADNFFLTFFLPNLSGGLILTSIFWKHHFRDMEFKAKNIWIPLAVVLFIYGLFLGFHLFGKWG